MDLELWQKIENPIVFNTNGPDPAHGYEADVLVDVCKAVSRAFSAGKLTKAQEPMARGRRVRLRSAGLLPSNPHRRCHDGSLQVAETGERLLIYPVSVW